MIKAFEKKKRKFLQEVKMSKEKQTKKQLYYYDRLCKKYSLEKKNVEELSKLDLRDEIERILNEHSSQSFLKQVLNISQNKVLVFTFGKLSSQ